MDRKAELRAIVAWADLTGAEAADILGVTFATYRRLARPRDDKLPTSEQLATLARAVGYVAPRLPQETLTIEKQAELIEKQAELIASLTGLLLQP